MEGRQKEGERREAGEGKGSNQAGEVVISRLVEQRREMV